MEMDCNLKILAYFLKFVLSILSFLREEEREDPRGLVVVTSHVTTGDEALFYGFVLQHPCKGRLKKIHCNHCLGFKGAIYLNLNEI